VDLSQIESKSFYLGIDGGGSKCRAVIVDSQGSILAEGVGGPANPLHGFQKTIDSILDASNRALKETDLDSLGQLIAGVGLAGVNLSGHYQKVNQWQHPFEKMYLTTDLDIANIGAHAGQNGAVIIVGTGSCGFARCGDESLILGGHGFPLGDKASGAWMGLEAVKHTLLVLDGFEKASALASSVISELDIDSALSLSEMIAGRSSRQYAKLASLVFKAAEEGDRVANVIVQEGVAYIVQMVNQLLKHNPTRLCMIGGLAKYIVPRLPESIAEQFVPPIEQPEIGAAYYAMQNWNEKLKNTA
jgi:glucosamine kinase